MRAKTSGLERQLETAVEAALRRMVEPPKMPHYGAVLGNVMEPLNRIHGTVLGNMAGPLKIHGAVVEPLNRIHGAVLGKASKSQP